MTAQFKSTDGHACKNLSVLKRTPTMQGKGRYILCQVPAAQPDAAAPSTQK